MQCQLDDLKADDLANGETVTVTTRKASHFDVQCSRFGLYYAYNRTEFVLGYRAYKTLAILKRDLCTR
jgi:hypothetical protein